MSERKAIVIVLAALAALAGRDVLLDYLSLPPVAPPPAPCEQHTFMCCRVLVEEPDCKEGRLACRGGFDVCEVEDAGP